MFELTANGWLAQGAEVTHHLSPNFNERPKSAVVDSVVVHCMSLPERSRQPDFCIDLFLNRLDVTAHPSLFELKGLRVSSHFLIDRQGHVHQFVGINQRAWHAGVSSAMGRAGFNDFSIGVELLGDIYSPYAYPQLNAFNVLLSSLKSSYPLKFAFAHSEIAPGRKQDPGPFFDWQNIRKPNSYELL